MVFFSPTYGKLTRIELKKTIADYIAGDSDSDYRIIVGVDSQKNNQHAIDFVTALVVQRIGKGGIYFWKRDVLEKRISLKERIYQEAIMSLQAAEKVVELFKGIRIAKFDFEIHVDIGKNGKTSELITEIVGMVRSSGYTVRIKPDSFGASCIADRHA